MTNLEFSPAQTSDDLKLCFPVLSELRPHLTMETFLELYDAASAKEGYRLIMLKSEGSVVALMGYRILHDFVHGRHLYVDDLVTTESQRSKGFGAQLLSYAENLAHEMKCTGLRLCTGIENERGKQFYDRMGWSLRAIVFKKKFLN